MRPVTYHDLNPINFDDPRWFWDDVMPGDIVHGPGTRAFRANSFANRTEDTTVLVMGQKLMLVLSRYEGVPGEDEYYDKNYWVTFTVLTRHGVLVVLKTKKIHDAHQAT
jgi:hypothetical protein